MEANKLTSLDHRKLISLFPWSVIIPLTILISFAVNPPFTINDLGNFRIPEVADTFYHPYWARWLFALLRIPSFTTAYLLLGMANIVSVYCAWRVFGGRHWMVFASYQMAWLMYYGQIDGLVIGGLALAWWSIKSKQPVLVGLGLALAMFKPNLTAFMMLLLWWWSPSRWKALIIPIIVALISFIQWGFWIPTWITRLFEFHEIYDSVSTNISLWPLMGPWPLLIWPLIFLAPLDRPRKMIAVAAGTMITVPYFPIYSSLMMMVMPIPIFPSILFQASFLLPITGFGIFDFMRAVPVIVLVWTLAPAFPKMKDEIYAVFHRNIAAKTFTK